MEKIKNLIRWAWSHSQNIVGWLGFILACISIYWQVIDKDHNLKIVITSYEPRHNLITFGVLYSNFGDYTETVVGGDALLLRNNKSGFAWGFHLENCFQPIIIKTKEAIHRYYTVKFPLDKNNTSNAEKSEHTLEMSFDILMPNGAVKSDNIKLGKIEHRVANGKIEHISIENNVLQVKFNDTLATNLGSRYISPTSTTPDIPSCSKQFNSHQ